MKVLLDENLPHDLRHLLVGHDVFTVAYLGWCGTVNGALLRRAADAGFDLLLTLDNGVQYQQNARTLPVAVVIVSAASSDIDDLRPLVPAVLDTLCNLRPRAVTRVP
jgi:hypothetical protein